MDTTSSSRIEYKDQNPDRDPLFQVRDLAKTYGRPPGEFQALRGVSLKINAGERLAILGKSGSGKSTLMHLMSTLDRPTSGEIWYAGQNVADFSASKLAKLRSETFGFIFQQFFLLPQLTVMENVVLPLKIQGLSSQQSDKDGRDALELVGLGEKARNKATDLSGGQKQRVAIARAMVAKPRVLFADEPTGSLDSKTGHQILDFLFKLSQDSGVTLITVTHDLDLARLFERHILIVDGQIAQS